MVSIATDGEFSLDRGGYCIIEEAIGVEVLVGLEMILEASATALVYLNSIRR